MPNIDYHTIIVALAALYWLGDLIVKGVRRNARAATIARPVPAPVQQIATQSPVFGAASWEMPRQPGAGGPAVYEEATERDFERQETELLTDEPAPLASPLRSDTPMPASKPRLRLFQNNDDLVRAFILKEALGLPHSKRRQSSQ